MARCFVNVRYRKTVEDAAKNVMYIGFRSRENGEEKGFFNERLDLGADYKRFVHDIETHPALQHSNTVKVHTMVLSIRENDYNALREAGGSLKDVARDVMKDLEREKGMQLRWIGALHESTGHPHVHLSVMSVGKDGEGNNKRLKLSKDDYAWLRERMQMHLERFVPEQSYERSQHQEKRQNLRRSRRLGKIGEHTRDLSRSMEQVGGGVKNAANKRRQRRRYQSRQQQQKQTPTLER